MQHSLAQCLKLGTRTLHAEVEQTGLMRELIEGRIGLGSYACLLRNLYELYSALEAALYRQSTHACIAPVFLPQLFRKTALAADLRELYSDRFLEELDVAQATLKYVARLREIEASNPELLVAHAYVRYLGDLSGGQMLKRIVGESLALPPESGVRFFDFGTPAEVVKLSQQFRSGLNAIGADENCLADIVAEAQRAFVVHAGLFEELALASVNSQLRVMPSIVHRERPDLAI